MWISARRASAILYNYLCSIPEPIKFLIPANVCPIVLATFEKARIEYELVDIGEDNLCINAKLVENFLKKESESVGILYVRTFGYLEDIESWFQFLKSGYPGVRIIDDRCLCKPSFDESRFSRYCDLTLFSTGYSKYVELGFGGYAWINDENGAEYKSNDARFNEKDHEQLVSRFNHAINRRCLFEYEDSDWLDLKSLDYPSTEYFDLVRSGLEFSDRHKKSLNRIYESSIPENYWLGIKFNDWRFSILVANKEEVIKKIFDSGFFASSHYASMVGIFRDGSAPEAQRVHNGIVNLFNDQRVSSEQAELIANIVRKVSVPIND